MGSHSKPNRSLYEETLKKGGGTSGEEEATTGPFCESEVRSGVSIPGQAGGGREFGTSQLERHWVARDGPGPKIHTFGCVCSTGGVWPGPNSQHWEIHLLLLVASQEKPL